MAMEFWIKSEVDNINFLLPVTPSKYEVEYANQFETVQTVVGDINIPTSYKLSNVIIEGFFTVKDYPFVNKKTYNANTNMDYVELIKMFIAYKRVVRLIIAKDNEVRLNLPFRVESITYDEDGGSGDINYKISFKEHRLMGLSSDGARSGNQNKVGRPSESKPSSQNNQRTHTVVSGDTLRKMARRYYGNGDLWNKIYNANKDKIKIPEKIYPDQVFVIP